MLIPSLLILSLLLTPMVEAYTVVTLKGKRHEGTLITDSKETVLIKDAHGVLISFQKQTLDWEGISSGIVRGSLTKTRFVVSDSVGTVGSAPSTETATAAKITTTPKAAGVDRRSAT